MTAALLGFLAIFVLALMRMPLAFSMGLVGIVGIGLTRGWMPAMASTCLLYTSPSPRDRQKSRMPSSA